MQVFAVFAVKNRTRVREGLNTSLTVEETFHVGQSLGRVLERLETQSKRLDDLRVALDGMDEKVSRLVREFGFIKKAWWVGLIALGYVLAKLADYLPAILSRSAG